MGIWEGPEPPGISHLSEGWKTPALSQVLLASGDGINTVLGCLFNKTQTKPNRRKTIKPTPYCPLAD